MSVVIKHRTMQKKMGGLFNTRTTATKWLQTILKIEIKFFPT